MKKTIFLLFIIFLCKSNNLIAQKIDSILNIYSEKYQQEKVHIHFDRSTYNKGETIWFKAYLMAGTDLSDYSSNFYVDWYDPNGKILKHTVYAIFESSARGQFDIPANYTGQSLHVRAYTNWMLNFDSAFLYNKDIVVSQTTTKQTQFVPVTTVSLFPEGGDLINGLNSRVAFMAVNQSGKPVNISGAIKNNKGELIDSLLTEHDGMGSFSLDVDAKETYAIYYTDEYGKSASVKLPAIKNSGAGMQVQALKDKSFVTIKRTNDADDNLKTLNLVAHMNQQVVYRSKVNLSSKTSVVAEIPTVSLPTGVLQITLFNANWQPVAERVVFVNNHQYEFSPEITTVTKGLDRRARNVLEINVPDTILSNLSVAVTDAGLSSDNNNTIISQLLLCGDIKGYINNPVYYFSNNSDTVAQHLDLVMLTHGWRRYKWNEIVKGQMPLLAHSKEDDMLTLKGKVYGSALSKMPPGQNLFLLLQSLKDTSAKKSLLLPIKADGSFSQDGIVFFDSLKVYYVMGNKKYADRTEVVFQNGLIASPKNMSVGNLSQYLWSVDTAQLARNRFFEAEQARATKLLLQTTLQEVIVRTKVKRPVDVLDEKYTSGLFSGGDSYQFDMINDPRAQSSISVFYYLQGIVAGLQVGFDNGTPTLTWRGGSPELFLDEIRSDVDALNTLSMSDIAYVKVFRPPFFGASGGGSGGAISVYTRRGGDVASTPGHGLEYKFLTGYTSYREFYSPNYVADASSMKPDVRTTLFWAPFVLTDKSLHKVKLEFYNNDISKKFRVVLEGMNADGKLARVEKIIE